MITRAGWDAKVGMQLVPRDGRRVRSALIASLPPDENGEVMLTDLCGHGARRVSFWYLSDRYAPSTRAAKEW